MATLSVGHKIKIIHPRWLQRRTQRCFARISNWAGRQSSMLVRIVKRIETEVLARQRPIVFSEALHSIDDGRIALQTHAFTQAIFKNAGHERPLFRLRRFPFDERRKRHDSKHCGVAAFVHLPFG